MSNRPDHRASPGLWVLAWRRLIADHVAVVSMAVVAAFLLLTLASALGLVASNWNEEVGIGYARPVFAQARTSGPAVPGTTATATVPTSTDNPPGRVKDPLGNDLAELRAQSGSAGTPAKVSHGETPDLSLLAATPPAPRDVRVDLGDIRVVDPIAKEFAESVAQAQAEQSRPRAQTLPFGADKWGHDIVAKTVKGSETSILVGLAAALVATVIGTLLGALAGYHGGWVDDFLNWFYNIFTAIPYLLLILAIAAVLNQKGVTTIILILGLTGWTGIFRLARAEYIKHRSREYVQAADAIGASNLRRMFVHIFPNVSHVSLVQLSVHTVGFIKSEVILSFLGFGVPVDKVSWGSMLGEAQNELILGYWWQLAAATLAMAVLVTAFSMFTDALRDALDPKIK
jgi:peptide/nickel transport system permease protein